jgi:hypothetical protein
MVPLSIIHHFKSDPPLWPAPQGTRFVDAGVLADVAILDEGMESGLPSVMIQLKLPDGTVVVAQQTARMMVMLGRAIMAKYPTLLGETPPTADVIRDG